MTYRSFYKIAKFLHEDNEEEIACLAYDYKKEYDNSISYGFVTFGMLNLCMTLVIDMDFADYLDDANNLTIEDMKYFLQKTIDELD